MKAITLYQPWATAIFLRIKGPETRSWKTSYRGKLAIHAAKRMPKWAYEFARVEGALGRIPARLPLGVILGFVSLTDMRPTEEMIYEVSALERLYGDYSPGRWAWMYSDIEALEKPIPARGARGLWEWEQ